ncbi:MAG: EF-hand domain-containing protein, partial [Ketobacter sp.]|nr:EF-hand domain-containing protein [Ketobacter sp.]
NDIGGTVYSTGVHFHASLYDFLTKDSSVKDLMGIHIVSRMKGEAKDTFDSLDIDGNGYIDREELKAVLYKLGEIVTDSDVTLCFDEIDSDQNGQITFQEFEHWYLASKLRMTTDVKV